MSGDLDHHQLSHPSDGSPFLTKESTQEHQATRRKGFLVDVLWIPWSMVWLVNRILVLRYQRLTVTRKRVTTKPSLAWLGHVFLKRRRGGKHEPREEQEILTP